MEWLHWSAPVVGVLFLGHLWLFLDGVMRNPDRRDRPPIEGTALFLLVSGLYMTLADPPGVLRVVDRVLFGLLVAGSAVAALARFGVVTLPRLPWRALGPWKVLLFGLPEVLTPVTGVRAVWRRTAPPRWCVRHPRTHRAFRRLGYRGPRVIATLARWFRPDQLRRLGWKVTDVSAATERMALVGGEGWDAEAFIRTVRATGRDHADQLGSWRRLHRLGVDDPTEYLRYLATTGIDVALRYALGPDRVPYDVVRALQRRGAAILWPLLSALEREYQLHRTCYWGGWSSIVAWIGYDESPGFAAALAARPAARNDTTYLHRWREWAPVGGRTSRVEPALWAAAGFTVDEALAVLDAGDEPDAEALRGLAALRRTA
jgi:hypothetical protein